MEEKKVEIIILTDDELKPSVPVCARLGPWNSDSTFGYSSVSIVAVEKAAETLEHPALTVARSRLKCKPERDQAVHRITRDIRPRFDREHRCRLTDFSAGNCCWNRGFKAR